jgi:hypothetical protein
MQSSSSSTSGSKRGLPVDADDYNRVKMSRIEDESDTISCADCSRELTEATAFVRQTVEEHTVCRECYFKDHKGEDYLNQGDDIYYRVDLRSLYNRYIRLDFDKIPTCSELHEAVKRMLRSPARSSVSKISIRCNNKPLLASKKPAPGHWNSVGGQPDLTVSKR